MKRIVRGLALSVAASSVLMAGGYKIPEQSLNSMALGAAYVAHTDGADANYFNPANMSFMADEKQYIEGGLTLAYLPAITYSLVDPYSGKSESENIPIPFFHYVSEVYGEYQMGCESGCTRRFEQAMEYVLPRKPMRKSLL